MAAPTPKPTSSPEPPPGVRPAGAIPEAVAAVPKPEASKPAEPKVDPLAEELRQQLSSVLKRRLDEGADPSELVSILSEEAAQLVRSRIVNTLVDELSTNLAQVVRQGANIRAREMAQYLAELAGIPTAEETPQAPPPLWRRLLPYAGVMAATAAAPAVIGGIMRALGLWQQPEENETQQSQELNKLLLSAEVPYMLAPLVGAPMIGQNAGQGGQQQSGLTVGNVEVNPYAFSSNPRAGVPVWWMYQTMPGWGQIGWPR